jgi:ribosomal protein S18 acetylase RimI-like enzyme
MNVRIATIRDAAPLADLGRQSFYEKWKDTTSPENMKTYLSQTFATELIMEEVSDPSVVYLVAEENNELIGYAKLLNTFPDFDYRDESIAFHAENPLEISRLYVAPNLIGKSIGVLIMDKIFEIAESKSCDLIWLGVWEKNPAVHFYQRHGFVKAGTHPFVFGNQVDTDWVMVKQI